VIEAPADFFAIDFGHAEFEEVADGGGDDVGVVFVPVFLLFEGSHAGSTS
jgi:hypothetical protein